MESSVTCKILRIDDHSCRVRNIFEQRSDNFNMSTSRSIVKCRISTYIRCTQIDTRLLSYQQKRSHKIERQSRERNGGRKGNKRRRKRKAQSIHPSIHHILSENRVKEEEREKKKKRDGARCQRSTTREHPYIPLLLH